MRVFSGACKRSCPLPDVPFTLPRIELKSTPEFEFGRTSDAPDASSEVVAVETISISYLIVFLTIDVEGSKSASFWWALYNTALAKRRVLPEASGAFEAQALYPKLRCVI